MLSHTSCRIVVQAPSVNVQLPRPIDRPSGASQTDCGGVAKRLGLLVFWDVLRDILMHGWTA